MNQTSRHRTHFGTILIAFLLCPSSAMLWVGKWRAALMLLAVQIAVTALVVWIAHSGLEPFHGLGQRRPEYVLYIANALVALPVAVMALKDINAAPRWYSSVLVVIAAYVVIGITLYHYAKPWLV